MKVLVNDQVQGAGREHPEGLEKLNQGILVISVQVFKLLSGLKRFAGIVGAMQEKGTRDPEAEYLQEETEEKLPPNLSR